MRKLKLILLFIGLFSLGLVTAASQTAKLSVDSQLYSSSSQQSSVVATLKQGTELTIEQRKGGWYQVKDASGQTGWVRSYDVQMDAGGNWFSRLKRVIAGGYSTESGGSATIGIRGLGPGDVKKATPNMAELGKLENYKVSLSQGKQYAASVPLTSKHVAYLEPITKTASSSSDSSGGQKATQQPNKTDGNKIKGAIDSLW